VEGALPFDHASHTIADRNRRPRKGATRSGLWTGWAGETCSRRVCGAPNGSEVHLRGQGPRAEADAVHGVHACESRDAGRAPPPGLILTSRLGRRTEAGPRQVLARVRPPRYRPFQEETSILESQLRVSDRFCQSGFSASAIATNVSLKACSSASCIFCPSAR